MFRDVKVVAIISGERKAQPTVFTDLVRYGVKFQGNIQRSIRIDRQQILRMMTVPDCSCMVIRHRRQLSMFKVQPALGDVIDRTVGCKLFQSYMNGAYVCVDR